MNNEQYVFVLGALARVDKKIDYLIEKGHEKDELDDSDEFEEEFDI
jgi:hypothetical protein